MERASYFYQAAVLARDANNSEIGVVEGYHFAIRLAIP